MKNRLLPWMSIPNLMTLSRLFSGFYLLFSHKLNAWPNQNTLIFLMVGGVWLTDLLDGVIARWLNQSTKLGAVLDQVVDRIVDICFCVIVLERFPTYSAFAIGYLILRIAPDIVYAALPDDGRDYKFSRFLAVKFVSNRCQSSIIRNLLRINLTIRVFFFGSIFLDNPNLTLMLLFSLSVILNGFSAISALVAIQASKENFSK